MRSMMIWLGRAGSTLAVFGCFVWVGSAHAQDPSQTPASQTPAAQDTSKKQDTSSAEPASPIGLAWADSYIHQIGSSGLLVGTRQGIGWGSLFIPSASATGLVDRTEATSTQPGADYWAGILQTAVVYDHRLGTSRVAIQYAPSMAIANGQVVKDFSNQNTSLDLLLFARPRWNVRFNDTFGYYYSQQAYGYSFFDVNPANSGAVTNRFLSGPTRWINDSAYLSVSYAMSRRTSISVSPSFAYSESGESPTTAHADSYGGTVNLNYRTSERQTVGLQYSSQMIHEKFSPPAGSTIPSSSDTLYNTIAGTLARQLSGTWFVRGAAGASTYTITQSGQSPRQWQFYGTFGLIKQLGPRSAIGLNYSRADSLNNGLISNLYSDRVDGTFHNQASRRFDWLVGGGYLRQVQSGGFSGWYTTGNAQFLLAPRAGLFSFFNFTHNNQGTTNATNLYAGNRDYISFGVRWQPGNVAH